MQFPDLKKFAELENGKKFQSKQPDDEKSWAKIIAQSVKPSEIAISDEVIDDQFFQPTQSDNVKTWANIVAKGKKLIEQETCMKVPDEQNSEFAESKGVTTSWADVAARLSESDADLFSLNKKINVSEKRVFNYRNLTDDAKMFLSEIDVETYEVLKQKIIVHDTFNQLNL